jgi:hypothetical protein
MSRSKYEWNEKKFEKFLKEKRGQGNLKEYKPWLTTQDVPSLGRRSRILGRKTGRLHHLLSDNESDYFEILDWADNVLDIREQFPLLESETAQTIAADMGVKYPTDKTSGFPYILSTDFLITIQAGGKTKEIARTIKPAKELDRIQIIEKFEIERRYWAAKDIDWGIVTEHELPKLLVANLESFRSDYQLELESKISFIELQKFKDLLKTKLQQTTQSVLEITQNLDHSYNFEHGLSLSVFRHLVAQKEIKLDMTEKIDLNKPVDKTVIEICKSNVKLRKVG